VKENIAPYLLGNLIPILLTLVVVIILLVIIDKIFAPFRKVKEKWRKYNENKQIKKIQALENEVKKLGEKYQENKNIIAKMNVQLTELSRIFGKIIVLETEYTKNMNDLEQKKQKFIQSEKHTNFFLNIIRSIQKIKLTKQIKKLEEKIKSNEEELNSGKETIRNKIMEMLDSINNQ